MSDARKQGLAKKKTPARKKALHGIAQLIVRQRIYNVTEEHKLVLFHGLLVEYRDSIQSALDEAQRGRVDEDLNRLCVDISYSEDGTTPRELIERWQFSIEGKPSIRPDRLDLLMRSICLNLRLLPAHRVKIRLLHEQSQAGSNAQRNMPEFFKYKVQWQAPVDKVPGTTQRTTLINHKDKEGSLTMWVEYVSELQQAPRAQSNPPPLPVDDVRSRSSSLAPEPTHPTQVERSLSGRGASWSGHHAPIDVQDARNRARLQHQSRMNTTSPSGRRRQRDGTSSPISIPTPSPRAFPSRQSSVPINPHFAATAYDRSPHRSHTLQEPSSFLGGWSPGQHPVPRHMTSPAHHSAPISSSLPNRSGLKHPPHRSSPVFQRNQVTNLDKDTSISQDPLDIFQPTNAESPAQLRLTPLNLDLDISDPEEVSPERPPMSPIRALHQHRPGQVTNEDMDITQLLQEASLHQAEPDMPFNIQSPTDSTDKTDVDLFYSTLEQAPALSMFSEARLQESLMGMDRELRDIQNEFAIFTQAVDN
eukprot:m.83018 g.83018  ORF g.83018 m.83018 type:complete len:532 (-) comp14643_c1_seq1:593-2188(-)